MTHNKKWSYHFKKSSEVLKKELMIKICGLKDRKKFTASHFKSLNVTFIPETIFNSLN